MKHFRFEFKKLIWTKKFLIALILLIVAVSLLLYRNILLQDYAKEQKMNETSSFIKFHRNKEFAYERELEIGGNNEETEMLKEKNEVVLQSALEWSSIEIKDQDWRAILQSEISFLEQAREYKEMGEEHPLDDRELTYRLTLNNELLNKNIPPDYEKYSVALPNFTKQVVDLFVMYGSFFIVLVLISELLSHEFESRSIFFQFTQPLNRANIVLSKFLSAIVMYIILSFVMLLISVVATSIFGKQGYFEYPILIELDGVLQSITITDYLTYALIANAVIIMFMIALYLLYSVLTQHTLLSLFLTTGTILFGYFFTMLINWAPFAWINPFRYVLSTDYILFQNNQVWYQAIPITIVLTIAFLIIAMQKIKKSKVE